MDSSERETPNRAMCWERSQGSESITEEKKRLLTRQYAGRHAKAQRASQKRRWKDCEWNGGDKCHEMSSSGHAMTHYTHELIPAVPTCTRPVQDWACPNSQIQEKIFIQPHPLLRVLAVGSYPEGGIILRGGCDCWWVPNTPVGVPDPCTYGQC